MSALNFATPATNDADHVTGCAASLQVIHALRYCCFQRENYVLMFAGSAAIVLALLGRSP